MSRALLTAFVLFGIAVTVSQWRPVARHADAARQIPVNAQRIETTNPIAPPLTIRSSFSPFAPVHSRQTSANSFAEPTRPAESREAEPEFMITSAASRLDPQPGDFVVKWGNRWWRAEALTQNGDQTLIRYVGYGAEWDEWVAADRTKVFTEGDTMRTAANQIQTSFPLDSDGIDTLQPQSSAKFLVEWNGRWWPADVLEAQDGKYFIHYEGYGSDWDEWIPIERLRIADQSSN